MEIAIGGPKGNGTLQLFIVRTNVGVIGDVRL
jgi:hypothetical protein